MTTACDLGAGPAGHGLGTGEGRGTPLLLYFGKPGGDAPHDKHAALVKEIALTYRPQTSLIALEDRERLGYYGGAAWFGESIDEVVSALRTIIAELAPSEIVTCGQGIGGHAALIFGVLLRASRIVAIEPPAHLVADELADFHDHRWPYELAALPDPALARRFDVSALIAEHELGGRAFVLLGTRRRNDHHDAVHQNAIHAHRLARSDRVVVCPFPELEPGLLGELDRRGDVRDVLARYLFAPEETLLPRARRTPLDRHALRTITTKRYLTFRYQIRDSPSTDAGPGVSYAVAGEFNDFATRARAVVDDGWRTWIAGNLLLGASTVSLEETLIEHGISEQEAVREVARALQSPYLWGAQRLRNRLQKDDWLLAVYRKLRRLHSGSAQIDRRPMLGRAEFLEHYLSANRPVILLGLIDAWPALSTWNLETLAHRFAGRSLEVSVPGCEQSAPRPEGTRRLMSMAELAERLRGAEAEPARGAEAVRLTARAGVANAEILDAIRDDLGAIADYLREDTLGDGTFQLVSAGAATPLELNRETRLVAQLLGGTWFKLAPSWDLPLLRPAGDVSSDLDGRTLAADPEPRLDQPQVFECLLGPGEVLILPAGWWSFSEASGTSASLSCTRLAF